MLSTCTVWCPGLVDVDVDHLAVEDGGIDARRNRTDWHTKVQRMHGVALYPVSLHVSRQQHSKKHRVSIGCAHTLAKIEWTVR